MVLIKAPYVKCCDSCRYWSEMIARIIDGGPMEAVCLEPTNPRDYTSETHHCEKWKSAHHGAIDEPPNDGERARALYDAEERS